MDKFTISLINKNDDIKQIVNVLKQLTSCSNITQNNFVNYLNNLSNNEYIYLAKIGDQIIAHSKLIIDHKLTHGIKNVGHIEDIVIDKEYRNVGFGKEIINYLINKCVYDHNCYKIILNCKKNLIPFYNK